MNDLGSALYLCEEGKIINNFGSCRNCDIKMTQAGPCTHDFIEKRYQHRLATYLILGQKCCHFKLSDPYVHFLQAVLSYSQGI